MLLQYVDHVFLCSPTLSLSQQATSALGNFLESLGYQVSPNKAQLCSPTVVYLGVQLSLGSKTLTYDRVKALRNLQPPTTGAQVLSCLSLLGFFRCWIPNFSITAKPLYQTARETMMRPLTHPAIVHCHFSLLQGALLTTSALALPYPTKPYHLYTDERSRVATGVRTQQAGPLNRAVIFLSKQLDVTLCGWQPCLTALAAEVELTREALKIALSGPIMVYSTHCLSDLLRHSFLVT